MRADAVAGIILDASGKLGISLTDKQLDQLCSYAELVGKWRRLASLTSASTPESFASAHIVDCLSVRPYISGPRVMDVGSGAGLPGCVLAIALPHLGFTLLEPRHKRVRFLTQARIDLELSNVEVLSERVEAYRPAQAYDDIIARAFGSMSQLLEKTRTHQRPGTRIIAMKGALDPDEVPNCVVPPGSLRIVPLDVPGYRERNLVIVEFSGDPITNGLGKGK